MCVCNCKEVIKTQLVYCVCMQLHAVAAGLARDQSIREAVAAAKKYVTEAIRFAPNIGQGNGPLNHFYMLRG